MYKCLGFIFVVLFVFLFRLLFFSPFSTWGRALKAKSVKTRLELRGIRKKRKLMSSVFSLRSHLCSDCFFSSCASFSFASFASILSVLFLSPSPLFTHVLALHRWSKTLPDDEIIEGVAIGSNYVSIITNIGFLRIYSLAGLQKYLIRLAGQPIAVAMEGSRLLVISLLAALKSDHNDLVNENVNVGDIKFMTFGSCMIVTQSCHRISRSANSTGFFCCSAVVGVTDLTFLVFFVLTNFLYCVMSIMISYMLL